MPFLMPVIISNATFAKIAGAVVGLYLMGCPAFGIAPQNTGFLISLVMIWVEVPKDR
jgi:hypothetical protein